MSEGVRERERGGGSEGVQSTTEREREREGRERGRGGEGDPHSLLLSVLHSVIVGHFGLFSLSPMTGC